MFSNLSCKAGSRCGTTYHLQPIIILFFVFVFLTNNLQLTTILPLLSANNPPLCHPRLDRESTFSSERILGKKELLYEYIVVFWQDAKIANNKVSTLIKNFSSNDYKVVRLGQTSPCCDE
ncbi:hypothetical protein KKB64_02295 [Patescibacteria group bacterium]|nr:hypothetical protein [Patescibacteria group bacterium]MBU1472599.1 hypothetical protein [Patescibacteria group bacterium]